MITKYNTLASEHTDEKKDTFLLKAKNLTDVSYMLRDGNFRKKVVKQCRKLFAQDLGCPSIKQFLLK